MFAGADAEIDVMQHDAVAARDIDFAQLEELGAWGIFGIAGFRFRRWRGAADGIHEFQINALGIGSDGGRFDLLN